LVDLEVFYNGFGHSRRRLMMKGGQWFARAVFVGVVAAMASLAARAQPAATIPADQLVQPAAFEQELQAHPHGALILQVGSHTMFDEDHIPGAEYVGPGSRPEGLQALRTRVAGLPHTKAIVLYCGCCPWEHCPNVAPAWGELHRMGFTHVRVLYIAHNFGADWVSRGYRAEPTR
jgi:3-mercaptopyruvate sulfurtransferase SseA